MALTDAEKVSIRRHLGYNAAAESNYPWLDTFRALSQVLDTVTGAAETETRAILTRLTGLETALDGAVSRRKASKVGAIILNRAELADLRGELRRWRRELSTLLGVPLAHGAGEIRVV